MRAKPVVIARVPQGVTSRSLEKIAALADVNMYAGSDLLNMQAGDSEYKKLVRELRRTVDWLGEIASALAEGEAQ